MKSVGDIIDGLIEEKSKHLATQELELVIDVFRQDFDKMTKLVNLFKRNKGRKGFEKSAYQSIAELLFQNGVKKLDGSILSVSQVNRYLGIVRKEKNRIVPSVGGIQSGKKSTRNNLDSSTVNYDWVYAKKSKVLPSRIENGISEMNRLRSEEKGEIEGWNIWNGKDEFLWRYILTRIDEWNKEKKPAEHWKYKSNTQSFKSVFTEKNIVEVYEILMRKLEKPIREI